MNPVWPTKSIKIFHGISMDINVWIGIKRFHGTKIEYILRLASLSYPDEYDFCWGFNPCLFWELMFVYAKQCMHICMSLWLTGCLTDHVLWYTKVAPAKDTLKKKRTDTDRTHTTGTLCAHSLFSPLAAVKTEHRGSVSDTVVMILFLYAWSANGFHTASGNSQKYMNNVAGLSNN